MRPIISFLLIAVIFAGCREDYNPPVISSPNTYLVVEGVLSVGSNPTSIRVTKTFRLNDTARLRPETNAKLQVEKEDNSILPLVETGNGYYSAPNLNLSANSKYRLRIKTLGGREYLSDFVTAKDTPPIDSISWKYDDLGVRIFANTHDPANNTKYYRWDYDETWEIRSHYFNTVKSISGVIVPRNLPAEDVSVCWKYDISNNILIGSTAQLQSDVIVEAPLGFIAKSTERLGVRYSVLVRQYAIDEAAYSFFEQMKRNTEGIGTFFGPLPSEMRGNIRCVNVPEEPVIGYITASRPQEKRIFIRADQVPGWNFYINCDALEISRNLDTVRKYVPPWVPFDTVPMMGTVNLSTPECTDCTSRKGSTIRPSYW